VRGDELGALRPAVDVNRGPFSNFPAPGKVAVEGATQSFVRAHDNHTSLFNFGALHQRVFKITACLGNIGEDRVHKVA